MNDELYSLLSGLDGIRQSPRYHPEGDALFHSLQVFDLARRATGDRVLWAAALFHDVGKAVDGPLHDEVGADLLEGLLPARAVWLVRHHLDLLKDPRLTRRHHGGTSALRDLEQLRRWDVRGRDPNARVLSLEDACDVLFSCDVNGDFDPGEAMSWERYGGLRAAIAQLAAQIMYGEDVKQYFTAKRLGAKRLLGRASAKATRYRPQDLPSNGEIKQALLELVTEIEGDGRTRRLFAMRVAALEAMEALAAFTPRLIGSVATGHVRSGSDIDIHVFACDAADVEARVRELGWVHETQRVSIIKHGKVMEFTHLHVPDAFPIELTVYPPNELRNRPRSSTDGKPIHRIRDAALRKLCEREHPELWQRYLADGSTPTLEEILAAEDSDDAEGQGEPEALRSEDGEWADLPLYLDSPDDEGEPEEEREPRLHRPRVGPKRRARSAHVDDE